jgi:hypothetical protein
VASLPASAGEVETEWLAGVQRTRRSSNESVGLKPPLR